jgi:SnoaL-like domain
LENGGGIALGKSCGKHFAAQKVASHCMNERTMIVENPSPESVMPRRILRIALAALKRGDFAEIANQFNDQFRFIDHALEVEFSDKERLTEFFRQTRATFPDSDRRDTIIISSENYVISEWTFSGTRSELFLGRTVEIPICVLGVSIVQIENGKITQWADYYDELQSGRYAVTDSLELWAFSKRRTADDICSG